MYSLHNLVFAFSWRAGPGIWRVRCARLWCVLFMSRENVAPEEPVSSQTLLWNCVYRKWQQVFLRGGGCRRCNVASSGLDACRWKAALDRTQGHTCVVVSLGVVGSLFPCVRSISVFPDELVHPGTVMGGIDSGQFMDAESPRVGQKSERVF